MGKTQATKQKRSEAVFVHVTKGFDVLENCLSCPHRQERVFCDMSSKAFKDLSELTSLGSYPRGATLFVEHQKPHGIFIIATGRIKLTTSSTDGITRVLRLAGPSEILGLVANITGTPHPATAHALEPSQVKFIPRNEFMNLVSMNAGLALRVAKQLAEIYLHNVSELRTIDLPRSATANLARFLSDRCADSVARGDKVTLKFPRTHSDIAQAIGVHRETVSRLFTIFKKKRLLTVARGMIVIRSRSALEHLANTK